MKRPKSSSKKPRNHTLARIIVLTIILFAGFMFLKSSDLVPQALRSNVLGQAEDPVIVAAGDIASCGHNRDEATALIIDSVNGTVLTLGDNVYPNGTAAEFTDCYDPTWGRHKARTKPAPGNHDYNTANASGYYGYFGALASPDEPACTGGCKGYYSYNIGDWHLVALNSEIAHDATSQQLAWLEADLAANESQCTLAYWHKPRFSSGQHGGSTSRTALWNVLYAHKADIVLNGHDHLYERFGPQNPNGQADNQGIRQFTVGTGGASLYTFPTVEPNSEVRENATWGVLKLTLHPTSYDWQFVPIAGQTFTDSGSASCVGLTGPTPTPDPNASPTPTPPATLTVARQIITGSDDAEEIISNTSMYITSSDLEFVTDGTNQQIVGMRFTDVTIPKSARITDAYIELTADEQQTDPTSLTLFGQAADNPPTFTGANGNISSRQKTGNSTLWNDIPVWTINLVYKTPNIAGIVSEIISRPGWNSGNAMVFLANGFGHRTADSYEGGIAKAPKLIVTYQTDTGFPTITPPATPTSLPTSAPTSTPVPTPTSTLPPTPTPTPTPPVSTQITINATDDAYIRQNSPASVYGLANKLELDNNPVKHLLLKFNVTGVGVRTVLGAKLVLYNIDKSNHGGDFYNTLTNDWTESSVTWSIAPQATGAKWATLGSVNGTASNPKPYLVDLTGAVTGDGTYSFRVISTSSNGADYISRQGQANRVPQLILSLSP